MSRKIKYLLLLLILLTGVDAFGQKITGFVTDKTTKQPLSGALVRLGSSHTFTNISGAFEITIPSVYDSLKVTHFAYKSYTLAISKETTILHIELEPMVTKLNEVTVHGNTDFKQDSIENRNAYAKQFNYTGPKVMDAFTGNSDKQPGDIISINPLLLVAALTQKSSPEYKFKKMLISDEHEQYVDEHFNKGIVSRITGLSGDTLSVFLKQYRPAYQFVLKVTDYEMEVYIKESFKKFKEEGFKSVDPVLNKTDKD
ncbi:MAG: carboxypeptidase-like regulatory domain-containing protein [Sphingobacteriales bacterium]